MVYGFGFRVQGTSTAPKTFTTKRPPPHARRRAGAGSKRLPRGQAGRSGWKGFLGVYVVFFLNPKP